MENNIYIVGYGYKFDAKYLIKNSWSVDDDGDLIYFGENIKSTNTYTASILVDPDDGAELNTYRDDDPYSHVLYELPISDYFEDWLKPTEEERTLFTIETGFPAPCDAALEGHKQHKKESKEDKWKL